MKTKSGNKLNMLLIAIILLLVFIYGINVTDTYSWLSNRDDVGFVVSVSDINLVVKQNSRIIRNGENIYLGTEIVEPDTTYNLNITITNDENGDGYYIRSQLLVVIGGTTYNINSFVTNNLYKSNDGWMYLTSGAQDSTKRIIAKQETIQVINTLTFPSSFIDSMEGENVKLFLYIEGHSSNTFA